MNLHVLFSIRLLDPVLRLLTDTILFRPSLCASTAACRDQLYYWRYQAHHRALTRRCFPPGWTLGLEVGGGNPPQSDRVDSNGNTECPCLAFVGPTSDYTAALAVRLPGVGRPLPVEMNYSGTEVVPCAGTVGRRGYCC
jgi:hypothetical protein